MEGTDTPYWVESTLVPREGECIALYLFVGIGSTEAGRHGRGLMRLKLRVKDVTQSSSRIRFHLTRNDDSTVLWDNPLHWVEYDASNNQAFLGGCGLFSGIGFESTKLCQYTATRDGGHILVAQFFSAKRIRVPSRFHDEADMSTSVVTNSYADMPVALHLHLDARAISVSP